LQILDPLRNQEVQRRRGLLGPNGSTAGPPEGLLRVCAHRPSALAILSAAKRPVVTGGKQHRPNAAMTADNVVTFGAAITVHALPGTNNFYSL
jgi:hypothetical protein